MSTVPPSPAWATTRTALPFTRIAAATPVATAGALPKSEWSHAAPRRLGIGRREHLEAPRRVDRDELAASGPHRRVEGVARPERLAAALAGTMTGVEGIRSAGVGLDGAIPSSRSRFPTAKLPTW